MNLKVCSLEPTSPLPISLLTMLVVSTMFELMEAVKAAADTLKQSFSNSIAISAGCDLFFRFVSSIRDTGGAVIFYHYYRWAITKKRFQDFDEFKREIKQACQEYAQSVINVKETIARHINSFIKDDSIVRLTDLDKTSNFLNTTLVNRSSHMLIPAL
jgi:translation initiation factor eIF-2B subunit alpha